MRLKRTVVLFFFLPREEHYSKTDFNYRAFLLCFSGDGNPVAAYDSTQEAGAGAGAGGRD